MGNKLKVLLGGSPCTYWSIAQKNNRETEPSGLGWELFENYLIAKDKFKPDIFLYENNKSAAQAIKDEIKKRLNVWDGTFLSEDSGARYIEINSALVSAQNRQRFYVHNCGDVEQPEDRGILLRDILERGQAWTEKSYAVTASYNGAVAWNTLERKQRTMVAEPIRIPEYGLDQKSRPLNAYYANNCGGFKKRVWSNNPNKQQCDLIAEPVRIGDIGSNSQAHRVYSCDGKSVTINAGGGGQGGKTGLYACPVNVTEDGKSQTIKAQYAQTSVVNICCYSSTYGASGVAIPTTDKPIPFLGEGKDKDSIRRVYEVRNGFITIKGKQYPIKLADGFYIIRKLTVTECCRLQTLPDNYCRAVSNTQAYKGLGNGWTAEVIIHILNGALKDVLRDTPIQVLSMYDGIGTGRYCLAKMGFTNVEYHAYEIDKYAMQVATSNFPDIIQHGNAFDVRDNSWKL